MDATQDVITSERRDGPGRSVAVPDDDWSLRAQQTTRIAARVVSVTKDYQLGRATVHALRGVDLDVPAACFAVLSGPSGSGKSTLLNLIGCLDVPTAGTIEIAGRDIGTLTERARTRFRAEHIGFVFQNFNLLPVLTALENVEYPLQLGRFKASERRAMAREALRSVDLGGLGDRFPSELSGGQRQRVAIARALVKQPRLVLADEPTANLDQATGFELISLMRSLQGRHEMTFIVTSHDPQVIGQADLHLHMIDGRIVTDSSARPTP
jgi:putative ABC transport system ATP-binding protein